MHVRNIGFGARIDRGTYAMLIWARKKGLKTGEMETLMKEVYPDRTIHTKSVNNYIDVVKNHGIKEMGIYSRRSYIPILSINVLDKGSVSYLGLAYKINQKTVDLITDNLKNIKAHEQIKYSKYASKAERELLEKFGEPVKRIGE